MEILSTQDQWAILVGNGTSFRWSLNLYLNSSEVKEEIRVVVVKEEPKYSMLLNNF